MHRKHKEQQLAHDTMVLSHSSIKLWLWTGKSEKIPRSSFMEKITSLTEVKNEWMNEWINKHFNSKFQNVFTCVFAFPDSVSTFVSLNLHTFVLHTPILHICLCKLLHYELFTLCEHCIIYTRTCPILGISSCCFDCDAHSQCNIVIFLLIFGKNNKKIFEMLSEHAWESRYGSACTVYTLVDFEYYGSLIIELKSLSIYSAC